MNWLFLNPIKDDHWGGMENWMLKLCHGLPAHGDSCLVAGRPRSRWPGLCRREGIAYAPFAFGFDLAPWAVWRLRRICRRSSPGIIVAKGFRAARFARLACPDAAIAVKLPSAAELTAGWTDQQTYHRCIDRILVDNHCARQAFLRFPWVLPGKIVTVHNGVALHNPADTARQRSALRAGLNLPPDALIVGAAGRFTEDKRFADAVEAFARVAGATPAVLVAIGDGPERTVLERLAVERGLTGRVLLPGWSNTARDFLAGCDVVVHPSGSEGLPNVVLEAMAAGVPVVATDAGGTREIIGNGQVGQLVPIGNVAAISAALLRLMESPALRNQTGAAARQHVQERFSLERMTSAIRTTLIEAATSRQILRTRPTTTASGHCWLSVPGVPFGPEADAWDTRPDAVAVSTSARATVCRLNVQGPVFYTKRFTGNRFGLRVPLAQTNLRVAHRLVLRGATVVPHLAAGWPRPGHCKGWSLLITGTPDQAVPLDRRIASPPPVPRRTLGRALAVWLAHLHGAGIACHDLKASNILVHAGATGELVFTLLDLDNCSLRRHAVWDHDAERSLHQLFRSFQRVATPRDILRFLAAYRRARWIGRRRLRRIMAVVEQRLHRRGTGYAELAAGHRRNPVPSPS